MNRIFSLTIYIQAGQCIYSSLTKNANVNEKPYNQGIVDLKYGELRLLYWVLLAVSLNTNDRLLGPDEQF